MRTPKRRTGTSRATWRDECGLSLIEVVVAIAVLAIVLVPSMRVLADTLQSSNDSRLEVEAVGVASSMLDQLERQAAAGPLETGDQSQTEHVGGVAFTVNVHFSVAPNASGSTECSGASVHTGLQIWLVSASVTWPNMGATPPVTEKTEVAPGATGALLQNAGELAVEVTDLSGNPITNSDPPIEVQVNGQLDTTDYPNTPSTPPTGESVDATGNIGSDGCAVFPNLDADPGWSYTVTLADNPGWVAANEQSDDPSAGSVPTFTGVTLQEGKVTVITGGSFPSLTMGQGIDVTPTAPSTSFFTTVANPAIPPASGIPITVTLPTSGSNTHTFDPSSGSISSLLLFPFNTAYGAWSGDEAEANPDFQYETNGALASLYGATPPAPTSILTTSSTASTLLSVYPLELALSSTQQSSTNAISAAETDGVATYALGTAGAVVAGASATGLPLGQYSLSESDTSSPLALPYVWIVPTGVFSSASQMTAADVSNTTSTPAGVNFSPFGQAVPES